MTWSYDGDRAIPMALNTDTVHTATDILRDGMRYTFRAYGAESVEMEVKLDGNSDAWCVVRLETVSAGLSDGSREEICTCARRIMGMLAEHRSVCISEAVAQYLLWPLRIGGQ